MIRNLKSVKKDFRELSSVVNYFKSEAVQLRVLELLLEGNPVSGTAALPKAAQPAKKRGPKSGKKNARKNGKPGPHATLNKLVADNFFKSPRTISDIVGYSRKHLSHPLRSNDISGKLASLVKTKKLKRVKSAQSGNYVYSNA